MDLGFLIIKGPLKGHKFQVKAGQTIGRLSGDIILQDPKISRKHARVDMGPEGGLMLVDLDSTSGVKVNGQKVHTVTLTPGLKLQLGNSLLEVTDRREEKTVLQQSEEATLPQYTLTQSSTPQDKQSQQSSDSLPTYRQTSKKPELESLQWFEIINDFLASKKHKIKDHPKVMAPFNPPVILTFIRGLQLENQWVIGYGPREIGAKSVDLPIFEPQAPDICFEILPTPQGPGFKTANSDTVLLNDKQTNAATLKSGDLISIFNCLIKVSFDEESQQKNWDF